MTAATTIARENLRRLVVKVTGAVQGVGFRPYVYRLAGELGLAGHVVNDEGGVTIAVEGRPGRLAEFSKRLRAEPPPLARIETLDVIEVPVTGAQTFTIAESVSAGPRTARVTIDVATCPQCLAEMRDPADRRYRYPFTTCTHCGPRYSIMTDLPYDRAQTTMAAFTMCPACLVEYEDPGDRRFHAQANACPHCGSQLALWNGAGETLARGDAALMQAEALVRSGGILARKGLGGFHLIADARSAKPVAQLRERKRRPHKPLAVMFPALEALELCCDAGPRERALLTGPRAPIVLLRKREAVPGVAGDAIAPANNWLGAFLPYTPLDHLLLDALGFAVVATSANRSGEPMVTDEHDALARLAGIADAFLVHDRPIARAMDDSVARIVAGEEMVLRRARGYAPDPLPVGVELPPAVALGGYLKSTVASSTGTRISVSQHIGDLDTPEAVALLDQTLADFDRFLGHAYELAACDLHPGYPSSTRARASGLRSVAVQHHAAHIYACMAEHGIKPPLLGVAWDGMGLGTDGTLWGGEFLLFDENGWRRVAHLRTFPLVGGDAAARDPRRAAFGLLHALSDEHPSVAKGAMATLYDAATRGLLEQMIARKVNAPLTSSAGRLFDAVAGLLDICGAMTFEGQAAMALEHLAEHCETDDIYSFEVNESEDAFLVIDWSPMLCELIEDVARAEPKERIARRLHNALAQMIAALPERLGLKTVAFGGGCFQNKMLTETSSALLRARGHKVYWPHRIPPNDGGLALGQLYGATQGMEAHACA